MLYDIFTSCKPFDQWPVQLSPGSIIDIAYVCVRLIKPGIADQTFQTVALTVAVFDIHQHPEAILKRNLFHPGVFHLVTECI